MRLLVEIESTGDKKRKTLVVTELDANGKRHARRMLTAIMPKDLAEYLKELIDRDQMIPSSLMQVDAQLPA